jgi:hypothetical protein
VTFLWGKQRTLHVFSESGKSAMVRLRESDGGRALQEAADPVPLGVHVLSEPSAKPSLEFWVELPSLPR